MTDWEWQVPATAPNARRISDMICPQSCPGLTGCLDVSDVNTSSNDKIEALRFLAAFAVVCVHMPAIGAGNFGVDIFFVISGLVMMLSTEKGGERFLQKRLIRIVPTYWLFTLGVFFVAFAAPGLLNSTSADVSHLLKSLFFIPFDKNGTGHNPVLFLGWTLNYEMYFYVLFAASMAIAMRFRAEICGLFLVTGLVLCSRADALPLRAYANPIVIEFLFGMTLCHLLRTRPLHPLRLLFPLTLTLIAFAFVGDITAQRAFVFGVPAFLLCAAALTLLADVRMPRLLVYLGGCSYALYLTHPYIIQVLDKVFGLFDQVPIIATGLAFLLVVGASALIFELIERPVRTRLRAVLLKRTPASDLRDTSRPDMVTAKF